MMPGMRLVLVFGTVLVTVVAASSQSNMVDQMTTPERLRQQVWWPTKLSSAPDKFVGNEVCAACHAAIVKSQATSEMAQTLMPAEQSPFLTSRYGKQVTVDGFVYRIFRGPEGPAFQVVSSTSPITKPLTWAFGSGKISQVYSTPEEDHFNESHFSYFESIDGFDLTPAQPSVRVASTIGEQHSDAMKRAGGRTVNMVEARRCFSCHAADVPASGPIANVIPGVSCEACHGPGKDHTVAMQAGLPQGTALIMNPARLRPVDQVDFCGACHATSMDIQLDGGLGLPTVRFPAYRLQNSRCWRNDSRIQCTACHDPHQPIVHEVSSYDQKCLACHVTAAQSKSAADRPGHACPVNAKDCAGCHMPKYDFPDVHHKFTDHDIRVVRAGAPFPG
jgi:hypothetical protein